MEIKTDFNLINELYLVYPKGIKEESNQTPDDYTKLAPLYNKLIKEIPADIKLKLYVKSRAVADEVNDLRPNMEVMINSRLTSIWLRDWSGFSTGDKLYKPVFRPKYYWGAYSFADLINQVAYSLHSFMGVDLEELPLILDGGNFVTNGEVAIITRRVVTDNKKTEKEIESILKDMLNITPVFVDEMKGEDTGHADGCVAFLSKNDVAVSKYPDDWYEGDREYVDGLAELLESKGFKVHRIMDVLQEPKDKPDGLFVNFLRLNDIILMPTYSHVDKSIIDANMATLSKFGKVIPVACDDLAKFGGVLHCISFTN